MIAALSETRIHGESQFDEVAAGCMAIRPTFLLIGHPSNGPSQDGVGFAYLLRSTRSITASYSAVYANRTASAAWRSLGSVRT